MSCLVVREAILTVSTFPGGFRHKLESFLELESPLSLPDDANEIWELIRL